jgi:hypothetical protein
VNGALVNLSHGVRHHAEGCVALEWNLATVVNNTLRALGSTPFYLRLPHVWGAVGGGGLLNPQYLWVTVEVFDPASTRVLWLQLSGPDYNISARTA